VVRSILESDPLKSLWRQELTEMRTRLETLRAALGRHGRIGAVDLSLLIDGVGMFAMLPLSAVQIDWLRTEFGIYMAPSGRINIAGMAEANIDAFVEALRGVQQKHAA
jgi:aromatic-amino-acid transaminase